VLGRCGLWEAALPAHKEKQNTTPWRSLVSSAWIGETGLSCRQVWWEVLGLYALCGNRSLGVFHRLRSCFPTLSGNYVILTL
jgi:hypothetical protein